MRTAIGKSVGDSGGTRIGEDAKAGDESLDYRKGLLLEASDEDDTDKKWVGKERTAVVGKRLLTFEDSKAED